MVFNVEKVINVQKLLLKPKTQSFLLMALMNEVFSILASRLAL